jgi:hypothetical protein
MVLKYVVDWSEDIESIIVPKNRNIEVLSTVNVVWITWNWYIKTWDFITLEWPDIRELIWKPLWIWTEISYIWNDFDVDDDSYIELEYYDWSKLSLDFEYISNWELYDLWYESNEYLFSMSRDNDYYYGVINWFSENIVSTSSKQTLLSPQIQADDNSPELTLNSIRVPVYQYQELDLADYIYEDSWIDAIKEAYIDFDLESDSSWDWNNVNDNDLELYNNLDVDITDENIILKLWIFEEIFEKQIWITLIDDNNNIWYSEITLDIYSPSPEINNYSDSKIQWSISEELTDEPINIYRYRWWVLTKLSDENWNDITYSDDWDYSFDLSESWSWVVIKKDDLEVAHVNENTWKITLTSPFYSIDVKESDNPDNELVYPKITITDTSGDLFYETIKVEWNNSVKFVDDFEGLEDSWIYVQFLNKTNYNYYILPDTVSYNPWSMSIYRVTDTNKESLFTIFKDGRINTINENYWLKYDYYDDYVVLKLIDKHFNREVASVLYKVSSDYLIN